MHTRAQKARYYTVKGVAGDHERKRRYTGEDDRRGGVGRRRKRTHVVVYDYEGSTSSETEEGSQGYSNMEVDDRRRGRREREPKPGRVRVDERSQEFDSQCHSDMVRVNRRRRQAPRGSQPVRGRMDEPLEGTAAPVVDLDAMLDNISDVDIDVEGPAGPGYIGVSRPPRNEFARIEVTRHMTYYRCNVQNAVLDLQGLVFTPAQLSLLKMTPFWPLFQTLYRGPSAFLRMCCKDEAAVRAVIRRLDIDTHSFYLGDVRVELSKLDVQLILGICGGTKTQPDTPIPGKYPPWVVRCFPREVSIAQNGGRTLALLKQSYFDKLNALISLGDAGNTEDVVRLTLFFIFAAILFPNQGGPVPTKLFEYVEDIYAIKDYDWATLILDMLMKQLLATKTLRAGGCYWLCEHSNLVKPVSNTAFPRILKWDLGLLYEEFMKKRGKLRLADLTASQVLEKVVIPTKQELKKFKELKQSWADRPVGATVNGQPRMNSGASNVAGTSSNVGKGKEKVIEDEPVVANVTPKFSRDRISESETQCDDGTPVGPVLDEMELSTTPFGVPKNSLRVNLFADNCNVTSPVCGQPSAPHTYDSVPDCAADPEFEMPNCSLGLGFSNSPAIPSTTSGEDPSVKKLRLELGSARALCDQYEHEIQELNAAALRSEVKITALTTNNRFLTEQVVMLEYKRDSLMGTIEIHEATIHDLEKSYSSLCMDSRGGEYIADAIIDRIKFLESDVSRLEREVKRLTTENGALKVNIHELQNPSVSQSMFNPECVKLMDAWVDVHNLSAEKVRLEAQRQEYEHIVSLQSTEIEALKKNCINETHTAFDRLYTTMQTPVHNQPKLLMGPAVPSSSGGTSTPPPAATNIIPVPVASIARCVKERTAFDIRVKKQFSHLLSRPWWFCD